MTLVWSDFAAVSYMEIGNIYTNTPLMYVTKDVRDFSPLGSLSPRSAENK